MLTSARSAPPSKRTRISFHYICDAVRICQDGRCSSRNTQPCQLSGDELCVLDVNVGVDEAGADEASRDVQLDNLVCSCIFAAGEMTPRGNGCNVSTAYDNVSFQKLTSLDTKQRSMPKDHGRCSTAPGHVPEPEKLLRRNGQMRSGAGRRHFAIFDNGTDSRLVKGDRVTPSVE